MEKFLNSAGGRVFLVGIFGITLLVLNALLDLGFDQETKSNIVKLVIGTGSIIGIRDMVGILKNGKTPPPTE